MRTLLLLLFPMSAVAAPMTLHHTVRVLDADGQPLEGSAAVAVSLFTSDDGTGLVFRQDFGTVAVDGGYLSLALDTHSADGTPLDSSIMDQSLWVGTEIDNVLQTPVQPLVEVPRAASVDGPVRPATAVERCVASDASTHGWMRFDAAQQTVMVCTNRGWSAIAPSVSAVEEEGVYRWSDGSYAASCEAYRRPPLTSVQFIGADDNGVYAIDPDGDGNPRNVVCDMVTDTGGWTQVIGYDRATTPCPAGLIDVNVGPTTACTRSPTGASGGESSATFEVGFSWQEARVQGTIWALLSPEAFGQADSNRGGGIDGNFVDGVTLTTVSPRTHVYTWTLSDNSSGTNACPAAGGTSPPSFVGSDYRCSFHSGGWASYYGGDEATVALASPTSQDIQVRVMSNQASSNEETAVSDLTVWVR